MKRITLLISVLGVAALACTVLPSLATSVSSPAAPSAPTLEAPTVVSDIPQNVFAPPDNLVDLYRRVNPGVVTIYTFAASQPNTIPLGQGSGFVIDTEGHIVTNQHVVDGAEEIEVDFPSGFKAWGKLVGTDPDSDLAVLKVDAPPEELIPIPLGNSDEVEVGEFVVAIGNPFGLSGSMTVGVVSAIGRVLLSERAAPGGGAFSAGDLIQTDAAINPGNSGGPLLNLQGQVIGVNRAITTESFTVSGSASNSGVGFAIPVNIVRRVVPALIQTGGYDYPYLGILSLRDGSLNLRQLEFLELPSHAGGVYITCVVNGGPADRAGIRGAGACGAPDTSAGGDLIIAIDGQSVFTFSDLISYLVTEANVGELVTLTVLRDGEVVDFPLTLEPRP
ncbi:MAG: trypsin-like peptidase domain-containing protein [Anaerolineae bacterium]|nr:MAG: trypsin-like peptidase domain-containing protein [Anaerolineae bacterium]